MSDSTEDMASDHIISTGLDLICPGLGLIFSMCMMGADLSQTRPQTANFGSGGQTQQQQQAQKNKQNRGRR